MAGGWGGRFMIAGITWAVGAGLMLGLYALPGKYTRGFRFENTWALLFLLTMFIVPAIATAILVKSVAAIFSEVEGWRLSVMIVASFLWGTGVMMWGKAIDHIGMALGFSLFIGTVILVGSLLPFFVDGLPNGLALAAVLIGVFVVLSGVYWNGMAGIARGQGGEKVARDGIKSVRRGIAIAVTGGLLATGFSLANAVGRPQIHAASQQFGNPEWVTPLAVMLPIFLSGGVVMTIYFVWQLSHKKAWGSFSNGHFPRNFLLILVMAFFHYAASAAFAYAAYQLGAIGNTVGYAIFNTTSVMVAVTSGIVTKEWADAPPRARSYLYRGLACMIFGILIISIGNALA